MIVTNKWMVERARKENMLKTMVGWGDKDRHPDLIQIPESGATTGRQIRQSQESTF